MPDTELPREQQRLEPLPPSVNKVLAQARALFAARKIKWAVHASNERMPERGFSFFDVEAVVMGGYVPDGITKRGKKPGEWKIKVVDTLEGTTRKMGVVCVVANERLLIIPTTEWEDR